MYEIKHKDKIIKAETYEEAAKIFDRLKQNSVWTRLYYIFDGKRALIRVASEEIHNSLKRQPVERKFLDEII